MATPSVTPTADEYSTPIPQGAAIAQSGGDYSTPIPQGATIGQPTGNPATPAQHSDEIQINPNDSFLTKAAKGVGGVLEGVGEGLFSTAAGASDLADKVTGAQPGAANKELHTLAGDNNTQRGTAQSIGYGGETLMEFMLGDEALKALPLAKRLGVAAKITSALEGSPRLMKAVQIGADALNTRAGEIGIDALKTGARTGLVQGGQTLVRTGGDVDTAAKQAGVAAVTGGAVGGITGAIGSAARGAGNAAENVKALSRVAEDAPTRPDIVQSLSDKVKAADQLRHTEFESGIQDLQGRLEGSTEDKLGSPVAKRAQELLDNPDPDEDPDVAAVKTAAGEKLDKPVRDLFTRAANGGEMTEAGDGDLEDTGVLDANGKPIMKEATAEEGEPQQWSIDNLIKYRQAVRKLSAQYPLGDVNGRALRQLLPAVDDTIDKLADQSKDATASADYQQLRNTYRIKQEAFNNPVIKKIMEGNETDAANDFITQGKASGGTLGGKKAGNIADLKTVLGDDGVHQFGTQIVHNMLNDATHDGHVNPAKFVNAWNKISNETKDSGLFDFSEKPDNSNPGSLTEAAQHLAQQSDPAKKGLASLIKDARSAAMLQHLNRVGVLGGAGAILGMVPIPRVGAIGSEFGAGLLSTLGMVSEARGVQTGRDILDYVANHPALWKTYSAAGKAASSPVAGKVADIARIGAAKGLASTVVPVPRKNQAHSVYSSLRSSLGGND